MKKEILDYSQISLYNTQRVTDEQSRQLFVARTKLLDLILNSIASSSKNAPPKHQLIVGQRGMGKTTLLKRIEVELRTNAKYKGYLPLLFPEEQYNLDSLTTFWLNCIDAIADVLEMEGDMNSVKEIDEQVTRLSTLPLGDRVKQVFMYFKHLVFNIARRPVLLIDNINLVFGRLCPKEQHSLRSYLTEDGAAIIVGASSSQIDDITTYQAPFYDAFQVHYLKKLSLNELTVILNNLAIVTGQSELKKVIKNNSSRLKAINQLTGGNPRTAVILFKQIIKGFSDDITQELDGILDAQTPLYKARFEELSEKMQIIVNCIAMQWDPVTLDQIREITQMENGQISPQLKRLIDFGWIERPKSARSKGGTYEISERMFNIWFLMRLSSRRQKKMVSCLSKFMEAFYEKGDELTELLKRIMITQFTDEKHAITALALAKLTDDKKARWELHEKTRQYIINHPESSECFEIKDLYDGAEEHMTALNNAITNKDFHAIVYNATPIFNAGNRECAPTLAYALIETGDFAKAIEVIDSIKDKETIYNLLILLIVSIHDFDSHFSPLIEKYCKKAIKCGNYDSDAYYYNAKFLIENERFDEALSLLDEANKVFPDDPQIISALGETYYCLGENDKAEKCFTSPIVNNEETPEGVLYYLGIIRYSQERYSEADALFRKISENKTSNVYSNMWMIPTLIMTGNNQESRKYLHKTIELIDNPEDLALFLFQMLSNGKKYDELSNYINIMMTHWPDCLILHYYLADSLFFQEDYSEAAKHVDVYLQGNETDADALFLRGMIDWQADGNAESAVYYIRKSIDQEENEGKYFLLGLLERELNNYQDAAKNLEKAIKLNPEYIPCLISLSEIYEYKFNNINRAQELAEKAYKIDNGQSSYRLANLYRDGMLDIAKAEEHIKTISQDYISTEWDNIHQILSSIHNKNLSIAENALRSFLDGLSLENKKREQICYLYAKCIEFGYGNTLLKVMEEIGLKETAGPEYYAVQSLLSGNPTSFFDTVAKEIREIGQSIARNIDFYIRRSQS